MNAVPHHFFRLCFFFLSLLVEPLLRNRFHSLCASAKEEVIARYRKSLLHFFFKKKNGSIDNATSSSSWNLYEAFQFNYFNVNNLTMHFPLKTK